MTYIPKGDTKSGYQPKNSPAQEKTPLRGDVEPTPFDPRIDPRFYDRIVTGPLHPVDPDLQFDPEDIHAAEVLEKGFQFGSSPSSGIPAWQCVVNETFTAAIVVPPGTFTGHLGARVEAPGTRAIVTAWQQATLTGDMYTVTLDSPIAVGPYQVVWMTDETVSSYTSFIPLICVSASDQGGDATTWPAVDSNAITPDIDEVASMEGTRARDMNTGQYVAGFSDSTFPAAWQVQQIINDAVNDVMSVIPDTIDPDYWPRARMAVKYLTAILIEQSYFREGGTSSGAVLSYTQRFNSIVSALRSTTDTNPGMRLV